MQTYLAILALCFTARVDTLQYLNLGKENCKRRHSFYGSAL